MRVHLDAFSAGDLEAMLATLDPTATFTSGGSVVDPSDLPDFFGWAIRELAPTMTVVSLLADGDRAACEFVESLTLDGTRQHLRRAFYRVVDGLIIEVKVYDERT